MFAVTLSDFAQLIIALATLGGVLTTARATKTIHKEVKTQNGLTIAALADRAEGRRIQGDIPAEDRTSSETNYVEELRKDDGR